MQLLYFEKELKILKGKGMTGTEIEAVSALCYR